jgi:hypothetical protein
MNDALRWLAKLFRYYGYDIKRHNQYNLLPVANIEKFSQLHSLYASSDRDAPDRESNVNRLFVCLRTCLRSESGKTRPPNVAGCSNSELVYRCIMSLIGSINHAVKNDSDTKITLVVFDDHSDPEHRINMEKICAGVSCELEIRTTHKQGQGESLLEQFEFARRHNALFYFCEDDYLHETGAILEMCRFYRQVFEICKTHSVIHPQEHDFLYSRHIYPAYLLLGESRHWRTISNATHTLFMHSKLVSDHWQYFENTRFVGDRKKRRLGVESRTTNHLFSHYPGFAPIPALAAHMQTHQTLPPFFEWQRIWEMYKPEQASGN